MDPLIAGLSLFVLVSLWVAVRSRSAWARLTVVTDLVRHKAAEEVSAQLGIAGTTTRWLRLVGIHGNRAHYAVLVDADEQRIAARSVLTRLSDGSVSVVTSLLVHRRPDPHGGPQRAGRTER